VPDHYTLHFASSETKPLACTAGTTIALGRFRSDVERLVTKLQQRGDTLISCPGRYAFGVALLASWLCDKAAVLPPNLTAATLQDIRSQLNIGFECDPHWADSLKTRAPDGTHGDWEVQLPADRHAVKLFTSGSTGAPKIIHKSIANLLGEAQALAAITDWPAGAIVAGVPAQHLYGLTFSLLLPWVLGNAWVDDMPHYPRDVQQALQQNGAGTLVSVPAQYQAMLEDRTELNDTVCISAAAPLPESLARQWQQQNGIDILEIYGSTETGAVGYRQQNRDSDWTALPHAHLVEEDGLLRVSSPFVSDDFANDFLTADRAEVLAGQRFRLLGRSDTLVKIAGKRVSLSRIEATLRACPGVTEAAVIAVPAKGLLRDVAIWAAVVTDDNCSLTSRQLQAELRDQLDGIEVPRRILLVERLPRTRSGKLPHNAMTALFEEHDRRRVQV